MQTIYKYPITLSQNQSIEMPKGSTPVLFSSQNDDMYLWMQVETEEEVETRIFSIYGTGHRMGLHNTHIASLIHGQFVWHLYEVK